MYCNLYIYASRIYTLNISYIEDDSLEIFNQFPTFLIIISIYIFTFELYHYIIYIICIICYNIYIRIVLYIDYTLN